MKKTIRVVQYGLGPIGIETAKTVIRKQKTGNIELVGAIDIDPAKAGRSLAEILGVSIAPPLTVSADAEGTLSTSKPDVVLHTTSSFLRAVSDQLLLCIEHGCNVVSSSEELFYPFDSNAEIASELDSRAKSRNVTIHATGVNPGFVMDTLPVAVTSMCTRVRSVYVTRIVDTSKRRLPLQRKTGVGLTTREFEEKKKQGTFGHIGLRESLQALAAGLGWKPERIEESLAPLIAEKEIKTPYLTVPPGFVCGLHERKVGYVDGEARLTLELRMDAGAASAYDSIQIDGDPPVDLVVRNGIFGDTATVAALVNAIPLVVDSPPGLKTTLDLPVPRAFAG